jgi:hypothetical protein
LVQRQNDFYNWLMLISKGTWELQSTYCTCELSNWLNLIPLTDWSYYPAPTVTLSGFCNIWQISLCYIRMLCLKAKLLEIHERQMIFDFWPIVNFFDICSNGAQQLYFCVNQFFRAIAIRSVDITATTKIICFVNVIIWLLLSN